MAAAAKEGKEAPWDVGRRGDTSTRIFDHGSLSQGGVNTVRPLDQIVPQLFTGIEHGGPSLSSLDRTHTSILVVFLAWIGHNFRITNTSVKTYFVHIKVVWTYFGVGCFPKNGPKNGFSR